MCKQVKLRWESRGEKERGRLVRLAWQAQRTRDERGKAGKHLLPCAAKWKTRPDKVWIIACLAVRHPKVAASSPAKDIKDLKCFPCLVARHKAITWFNKALNFMTCFSSLSQHLVPLHTWINNPVSIYKRRTVNLAKICPGALH